jgi:hypothetical protein
MYFDNNRHIDEYFRNHLKDYSQIPDDNIWKKIEAHLSHESKVRKIFIFKMAALALLILGLSALLAIEVSYYSPANTSISSTLKKDLSIPDTKNTKPDYPTFNSHNFDLASSNKEISDVSVPEELLFAESFLHSNDKMKKYISFNEERLTKLTSLTEPMKLEQNESSNIDMNTGVSDNFYFSGNNTAQLQNISFSQKDMEKNKFSLSGSFSPILSYRHSKVKNTNNTLPAENSLLSYSGGMDVSYNLAEKLTFRTGMHYTKFGQSLSNVEVTSGSYTMDGGNTVIKIASSMGQGQVQYEDLVEAQQINKSPKYISYDNNRPPEFTVESSIYQTFEMVKMPFLLEYTFLDDKFNFSMIGGVNANLLVNEGIYMEQAQKTKQIGTTKNLSTLSYSGTIGVGFKYNISSKAQLFMEPSFDYYITSLTTDNSYQTFPYFFGFFSGVSISF